MRRSLNPASLKQRAKQVVRRLVGEPYVGKRLKLRWVDRALDRLVLRRTRILDAGCEDATFVYRLADRFPYAMVVGVDIDDAPIAVCRDKLPAKYRDRIAFLASSFDALPDSSFDLVTVFDVLEHIADDLDALRRLHRALRPVA